MRIAWVLNLDADEELRDPTRYTRRPMMLQRIRAYVARIEPHLGPGDVVLDDGVAPERLEPDFAGQAWCPTPRALQRLQRAGVQVPAAPALEVLCRVNSRRWTATRGQRLEAARYVESIDELDAHLETLAPELRTGVKTWVVKSAFGFAGRGQKRFNLPLDDEATRRWVVEQLASGNGAQVEPWVERCGDFGLHGWIEPGGTLHLGVPTTQRCDARGAWLESRAATPDGLEAAERGELIATAERLGHALHTEGYFGPFGVDAYRWRDANGRLHFNACSEINARYSMGWYIGMHGFRPPV